MRASPLLLIDYYTTNLSFSAQLSFESNAPDAGKILPSDLKVMVEPATHEDNPLARSYALTVELADPTGSKFPCIFSISLIGYFEVTTDWPEAQIESLFSANAPAVLYSAAREAIALVTGRSPYRKVLLPSITFVPLPVTKTLTEGDETRGTLDNQQSIESANKKKTSEAVVRKKPDA